MTSDTPRGDATTPRPLDAVSRVARITAFASKFMGRNFNWDEALGHEWLDTLHNIVTDEGLAERSEKEALQRERHLAHVSAQEYEPCTCLDCANQIAEARLEQAEASAEISRALQQTVESLRALSDAAGRWKMAHRLMSETEVLYASLPMSTPADEMMRARQIVEHARATEDDCAGIVRLLATEPAALAGHETASEPAVAKCGTCGCLASETGDYRGGCGYLVHRVSPEHKCYEHHLFVPASDPVEAGGGEAS